MTALPRPGRLPAKYLPKVLLGHAMETLLSGAATGDEVTGDEVTGQAVPVASPWDVWWACYRAAIPLERLGVLVRLPGKVCGECARDALALAAACPPRHPGLAGARPCGCLLEWAVRMRAPAAPVAWPPLSLTLALLKPGAPRDTIRGHLEATHRVLQSVHTTLRVNDTRRLYPEAYGAEYVAARDRYMTSSSVMVLVLRARPAEGAHTDGGAQSTADQPMSRIKDQIRDAVGGSVLRNHLHMPDNPGEALADIAHLAGADALAQFYERYERDRAAHRLAFYRAALGIGRPDPGRGAA